MSRHAQQRALRAANHGKTPLRLTARGWKAAGWCAALTYITIVGFTVGLAERIG